MKIITLMENTAISDHFRSEHGLSLYIEAGEQKILFDVGASPGFLDNAKEMGVTIADVDYLVISHGHYDHGGGLACFLQTNRKAEIFIHHQAFTMQYAQRPDNTMEYIGLEQTLAKDKRITFTSGNHVIAPGIELFTCDDHKWPLPKSNRDLLTKRGDELWEDSFNHEQNLIIEENGQLLLIVGCAHNGICNILRQFQTLKGRMPDNVIGGFHLSCGSTESENAETIDRIAHRLLDTKANYYTCHCTGLEPYSRLKTIMADRIDYLSAGSQLEI